MQITSQRINKHLQNTLKLHDAFMEMGYKKEAKDILIFGSFVADLALTVGRANGTVKPNIPNEELATIGDHAQSDYMIEQEAND